MSKQTALRVADLSQTTPTRFDLRPAPAEMQALAAELGLSDLRKLRFAGRVAAHGETDWELTGRLGATVVQPCVVTLEPVTTRIDIAVRRHYLAHPPAPEPGETEMPADDTTEPLGTMIDPAAVMAETLSLAVPLYPRKPGADLGEAVYTEPGRRAMRDADARPFAGLAGLRETLKKGS